MKIYCNTQPNNPFEEFIPYIGKDIWVKVQCMFGARKIAYIRIHKIIYKHKSDTDFAYLDCDTLLEEYLDKPNYTLRNHVGHRWFSIAEPLEICQPIETLTSEELFDGAVSSDVLLNFVGQPIWVKCELTNSNYFDVYLKILSKTDDLLECQHIANYYVDDYEYGGYDENSPSTAISEETCFIDKYIVCEPLEILTDEEFNEIIAENDKIYWEGYNSDPDNITDEEYEEEYEE